MNIKVASLLALIICGTAQAANVSNYMSGTYVRSATATTPATLPATVSTATSISGTAAQQTEQNNKLAAAGTAAQTPVAKVSARDITEHSTADNDLKIIAALPIDQLASHDRYGLLNLCVEWRKPVKVVEALIARGAKVNPPCAPNDGENRPLIRILNRWGEKSPQDWVLARLLIKHAADLHTPAYLARNYRPSSNSTNTAYQPGEWLLAGPCDHLKALGAGLKEREKYLRTLSNVPNQSLVTTLTAVLSGTGLHVKELIHLIADYQSYLSEADEALLIKSQKKSKNKLKAAQHYVSASLYTDKPQ